MSPENWDDVSFVIASRYRIATLRRLAEGPETPSNVAQEVGLRVVHVSRALQELKEQDLVKLLVSEEKSRGRVYSITDAGEDVWELIDTEDMVSEQS